MAHGSRTSYLTANAGGLLRLRSSLTKPHQPTHRPPSTSLPNTRPVCLPSSLHPYIFLSLPLMQCTLSRYATARTGCGVFPPFQRVERLRKLLHFCPADRAKTGNTLHAMYDTHTPTNAHPPLHATVLSANPSPSELVPEYERPSATPDLRWWIFHFSNSRNSIQQLQTYAVAYLYQSPGCQTIVCGLTSSTLEH